MSGQATPGFMAASTARMLRSTSSYTPRWRAVKLPLAGMVHVMSLP